MPVPMQFPTKASSALVAQGLRRTMSRERDRSVSTLRKTSVLTSLATVDQPVVRRVIAAASYSAAARMPGSQVFIRLHRLMSEALLRRDTDLNEDLAAGHARRCRV